MHRRLDPVTGLMVLDGESVPSQVRNSITADIAEVNNKIQVFYPLGAAGTVPTSTGSGSVTWEPKNQFGINISFDNGSFDYDIDASLQTANRTAVLPDRDGTFAFSANSFSGIDFGSISGNPSAVQNGQAWYDTAVNQFKFRQNAATIALSTMAGQDASNVTITGGSIGGITDLAVTDGGTGASTAAGARVNLDVPSVGDLDAQRVDIQTFGGPSTSGSFTWVKPANAKLILVRIIGAGSGGASGICRATSVLRTGGGGGAGGAAAIQLIPATDLPASVAVTVGAGTVGGIGTNNTAANHANAVFGGASFFGNYRANGGGSTNGTTAATGLSGSVFSLLAGAAAGNGGAGNTTGGAGANAAIQPSHFIATGGGGGASAAAGNTTGANGGNGGDRLATSAPLGYGVLLAGGTGGVSGGAAAGAGNNQDQSIAAGTGGGGGAYATGANGGNGGQGGWPGGGGGGGGAADDGFTAGSGGRGGHGMVQVITYF